MTIFELVKTTLDELYAQGRKQYGDALDHAIQQRIFYLEESYKQLTRTERAPLDYKDPQQF
jgi:hypothetical protein